MSSTVDRLAFPVPSTDSRTIVEGFMPICIKRQDKSCHGAQVTEPEEIIEGLADKSAACLRPTKTKLRMLCGAVLIIGRTDRRPQWVGNFSSSPGCPGVVCSPPLL